MTNPFFLSLIFRDYLIDVNVTFSCIQNLLHYSFLHTSYLYHYHIGYFPNDYVNFQVYCDHDFSPIMIHMLSK